MKINDFWTHGPGASFGAPKRLIRILRISLEVGGVSQVSPDAQPGNRFVSFVRAGEARRGEAA